MMLSVPACISLSSASQPPDVQFVREKIPVQIQRGKPLTIEIDPLSGNGANHVGIRSPPGVWNALTNGTNMISVQLKSSNKPNTNIGEISPGGGRLWSIESFHYLFYIGGEYHAKASVEITFSNAPEGITSAEIIVCKTPADTGL